MREIKFRGRNYDGIWMYGYLMPTPKPQIHLGNKHCVCACPQKMSKVDVVLYEVEESTIGQYTGLLDGNGQEIFEGDVVRIPETEFNIEIIGVVEFDRGSYFIRSFFSGTHSSLAWAVRERQSGERRGVVIGNIHDNPELIKEEEK